MQHKMAKLLREGRRNGIQVTKFIQDVDEDTAHWWEGFLIRALGRRCDRDGPLCNLSWGGDRTNTGYRHSPEQREKIGRASRDHWRDLKQRELMRESMRGPRQHARTPKTLEQLKASRALRQQQADEKIRRLQAGCIKWVAHRSKWVVKLDELYIGSFPLFTQAEQCGVDACKAKVTGKFAEFLEECRSNGLQQRKAGAWKRKVAGSTRQGNFKPPSEFTKQRVAESVRKRSAERVRRLQAGRINWEQTVWKVWLGEQYIASYVLRTHAEAARVAACRAKLEGRFDQFCVEEKKRAHAFRRDSRVKQQTRKRNQLGQPWLVDSPYCVFALLVDGRVDYTGFGRPDRIWRLLYKKEKPDSRVKQWLASLDKLPEIRAVFMETREQAIAWRRAWQKVYQPRSSKGLTTRRPRAIPILRPTGPAKFA